jgi:hypothetical protein
MKHVAVQNGLRGEEFLAVNCYSRSLSGYLPPLWVFVQQTQPVVSVLSQVRLIVFTHYLLSVHFNIIVHCTWKSSLPFLYLAFSCWNSEAVVVSPMRAMLRASLNLSIMTYNCLMKLFAPWWWVNKAQNMQELVFCNIVVVLIKFCVFVNPSCNNWCMRNKNYWI